VRGDTLSSRRLFSLINANCIPVVVGDWIVFPFSDLIDYSKFVVVVTEGEILTHPEEVIKNLRKIPKSTIASMKAALIEASVYLMYDSSNVVNPITLMFVEALLTRIKFCKNVLKLHRPDINGIKVRNESSTHICLRRRMISMINYWERGYI
jgi:hypothetical protein